MRSTFYVSCLDNRGKAFMSVFSSSLFSIALYSQGDSEASEDEVPYPLELMFRPLRKRFRYHFHGKRQTNDIKKVQFEDVLNAN